MSFRLKGLGFRVQGLGFGVQDPCSSLSGKTYITRVVGFRVLDSFDPFSSKISPSHDSD